MTLTKPKRQSAQQREEIRRAIGEALDILRLEPRPAFERKQRKRAAKPARLIAYDFETERIRAGTPRPLYLTAYGADFAFEGAIADMPHLTKILRARFLTEENRGAKFCAWNGNRFDAYFIAAALVTESDLVLLPYMTKSKALRGLRVIEREHLNNRSARGWEFLDGIAMTGLVGVTLDRFTETFASQYRKMTGAVDFEREEFDPENPIHRAYAMRDSVGLYHAIERAQSIVFDTFGEPLGVTMGGACIKIFQAHIPADVVIDALPPKVIDLFGAYVMRGGFCYCVDRYRGRVWKYDINQAYAAAMRDAALPCGAVCYHPRGLPKTAGAYIARITADNPRNKVPFYYRSSDEAGRVRSRFDMARIDQTWLTSIEIEQLKAEGWSIECSESYSWPETFSMREYVDKLERLRTTCEGGPSGAIGTMVKAVGNHSYGKTVETIEPIQYIIAAECPDDALPFYGDGSDPIEFVFYRIDTDRKAKAYHQPHLGAWITAHVRMVLRRAILRDPDAWLYADTDCIVFSRDVTKSLDIDAKRYGAWKIEESGAWYEIIAKKVYAQTEALPPDQFVGPANPKHKRSAKGLNVRRLTPTDFHAWHNGRAPVQSQTQVQNFIAVLSGADMFRQQTREGTRVQI